MSDENTNEHANPAFTKSQDQLTREEKLARAQEVQRLMNHPMMREAFANIRQNYFEAFCACPPEDVHKRDQIFHCGRVVADVLEHFAIVMGEGKVAQHQIDKIAARGRK